MPEFIRLYLSQGLRNFHHRVIRPESRRQTGSCNCHDFSHLLRESLCARLTEALAEWMQEQLSEGLSLIRPAFGYSACPDHSLKKDVFDLLDAPSKIGVSLTTSYAIYPTTSLCGMLIAILLPVISALEKSVQTS